MIEIICRDDRFLAKGTFSVGIAGVFENKIFGDGNIVIDDTLPDILEELEEADSFSYQPLFSYLKGRQDGDSIARGLAAYYNQKEKEIEENVKQINDCILYHLFDNLEACAYPFWEIEEAVIPGSLEGVDVDDIYNTEESVSSWWSEFEGKPNNGTIQKVDVEGKLRKMFPMFNFDGLYRSIVSEYHNLSGRFIQFQFSDNWGSGLFDAAYDEFDEDLTSCEWHNH